MFSAREQVVEEAKPDAEADGAGGVVEAVAEAEGIEVAEEEMVEVLAPPRRARGAPRRRNCWRA